MIISRQCSFAKAIAFSLFVCFAANESIAQVVTFFTDSNNPAYYDSGLAFFGSPSFVLQGGPTGDKIPVVVNTFSEPFQSENSLRVQWESQEGGFWSALVIAPGFPFQDISELDTLSFWIQAVDENIPPTNLPYIYMEGAPGNTFSNLYPLSDFSTDLILGEWTQIKISLDVFFDDPNQSNIDFTQIKAIIFGQGGADDALAHELLLDEVEAWTVATSDPPAAPQNFQATGYDSHIELNWTAVVEAGVSDYQILREETPGEFVVIAQIDASQTSYIDFVGQNQNYTYEVITLKTNGVASLPTEPRDASTLPFSDEDLLDMVQAYTFRYFYDFGHPLSGMIRERNTNGETVTTGGTGFGIMGLIVGIERGFITRDEGIQRLTTILNFLENADRFHGVFPHWMNGSTGEVIPFGDNNSLDDGGDLVETAFLMQGLLTAREYFLEETTEEQAIRNSITLLWEEVEWDWYRRNDSDVLYWHWSPNFDWAVNFPIRGYHEALIVYLLAVASPTHPVPASLYHDGWAGGNYENNNTYYGHELSVGPFRGGPLFFAHYSFMGFDPRNVKDDYANYFNQNINHTLINRDYCIDNPQNFVGYSENCWGLTASDDPFGYLAHEPTSSRDNGTITPTAALSSMPYTPTKSFDALKHFYRNLGDRTWGTMGFYDAFNETVNWYADTYLAIDQGPILNMIENYRTGLLWNNFMQNEEIQTAMDAIGFEQDLSVISNTVLSKKNNNWKIYPNPSKDFITFASDIENIPDFDIEIINVDGQIVKRKAMNSSIRKLDTNDLESGMYIVKLIFHNETIIKKIVILE